ncbi:MAG: pyridoxal phosphate-dependent class II aminotransferase [Chlorobi bacterium]|nr:pyridoxal phosphate-dependent class II aminotransferase [Chlorobiota bacterium]
MIHGHGNDLYKHPGISVDFSSNVWYKGMPDGLTDFLKKEIDSISHYPEPDAGELASEIAALHNIPAGNVLVTNGATEAFYLIAKLYENRNSTIFYPSFSEYEDACRIYGHKLTFTDIKKIESFVPGKNIRTAWYGNPNNPDGTIIPVKTTERLCKNNPETQFIVDEAYCELCHNAASVAGLSTEYDNLIVIRSMTKAFGIPGIRIGYIIASEETVEKLKAVKMPWSVSTLAIKAGEFITENYHNIQPDKKKIWEQSKEFQNNLRLIPELEVYVSDCNFFMVKLHSGRSDELKQYLIKNFGILIRDASNFRGLNSQYIRLSVQSEEDNRKLIEALKVWSKEKH